MLLDRVRGAAIKGYEEVNIAQVGLISIQNRVPDDLTHWKDTLDVMGRAITIECIGASTMSVPHGIDNDVSVALVALFVQQGAPRSNQIRVTSHELLMAAGLDRSGKSYRRLADSLGRLEATLYKISGWRDHANRRWSRTSFRYIARVTEDVERDAGEAMPRLGTLDRATKLLIELPGDIADSIRAGYVKPIDLDFLRSLSQPVTRGLYRRLDAWRHDPVNPDHVLLRFEVPLTTWARLCRIVTDRTELMRRALEPAHEELVERGYLREVEYRGRGQKQTLTYHFQTSVPLPLTETQRAAVDRLAELGAARGPAEGLARQLPETVFLDRVALAEHLVRTSRNVRNKGGLAIDVVHDTEGHKYALPDGFVFPSEAERRRVSVPARRDRDTLDEDELSPPEGSAEQTEQRLRALKVLLHADFSRAELAAVERLARGGELDVHRVYADVLAATVGGETERRNEIHAKLRAAVKAQASSVQPSLYGD